jgi:hypothetical protein
MHAAVPLPPRAPCQSVITNLRIRESGGRRRSGRVRSISGSRHAAPRRSESELKCPVCGEIATRKVSGGSGLVFKGSGFYITDYGKDGKKDQRLARPSSEGEAGGAKDSGDKGKGSKGSGSEA